MLPIGTIIYNKNNKTLQMVISYFPSSKETRERFDYLTCLYPVGYGNELPKYLVNEEDIKYVVFEGLKMDYFDDYINEVKILVENSEEQCSDKLIKENVDLSMFTEL